MSISIQPTPAGKTYFLEEEGPRAVCGSRERSQPDAHDAPAIHPRKASRLVLPPRAGSLIHPHQAGASRQRGVSRAHNAY
jgi:hypothetical protein